ncbi:MAG: efflux RND transporter periplasmic adaptor subunit [Bacteroidetes bacterium]|nr:efflux RND transporter periplasmic adaptor subunit [Bacteroidota bacterium]
MFKNKNLILKNKGLYFLLLFPLFFSCGEREQGSALRNTTMLVVDGIVLHPRELEEKLRVTGTILANEEVDIRTEISGRITSINFSEDSRVNKGDLLVRINDSELQAQLKKLELEKKLAEDDVFRKTKLLEMNAVSQEEYDVAVNQLGIIEAEIELLRSQIAKCNITAPFSGKVGLRMVSPGAYVSPATLITHLQDYDPVRVEFAVQEKYQGRIDKGTLIRFELVGIDSIFSGKVYAVDSRINQGTRTFTVRAYCSNGKFMLVPGAFARVEVFLANIPDALLVPSEAIIPDIRGEKIFLAKNGHVRPVYVKSGMRTEREVEIVQGVMAGDTVITTGLLQIRENMPIQVNILPVNNSMQPAQ